VKHRLHEFKPSMLGRVTLTIFVTLDEGCAYYDAGYIQPLDFFGDGPRIP
jgi:hypothetical protein